MSDDNQKYFVSVEVKWGKQAADGTQIADSVGTQNWGALTYAQSVVIQGACVVPGITTMIQEAVNLGLDAVDISGFVFPDSVKDKIKGKKPA